jgi:ribose transport system permease protein
MIFTSTSKWLRSRETTSLVVAVILFAILSLSAENFLTIDNLFNIAALMSLWTIVGVGMTFLFISNELDLSVGSLFGFLVVFMGVLIGAHEVPRGFSVGLELNIWISGSITIGIGMLVGLMNGLLTTKLGLPSFVVTLAGWTAWRGAMLVITDARAPYIKNLPLFFTGITHGKLLGVIPWIVIWMALIAVLGQITLTFTKFGHHVYATGGNLQAARNTGIRTDWIKIACFVLTDGLVGFIAVLWVGFTGSSPLLVGVGFELQVIAIVIIGGIALTGGKGSVIGTLIGASVFGIIYNGLVLAGLRTAWQSVVVGAIIIVVAGLNIMHGRESKLAALLFKRTDNPW